MKFLKCISNFAFVFIVFIMAFSLSKFYGMFSTNFLSDFLIFIVALFLGIFLQTIIHELGHVIFGVLTKYEFISMRIGSLLFIKDKEKFRMQRFKVPGTLGQSIMMPKSNNYLEQPYLLYCLGGVILNFISSILFLLIAILMSGYISVILCIFSFIGLIFIVNNGIPRLTNGLINDGYTAYIQKKSDMAHKSTFIQLKIYAFLNKGLKLSQMPKEWLDWVDFYNVDLSNPIYLNNILNKCSLLIENKDFKNTQKIYQYLFDNIDKSNKLFINEIKCELLFTRIMNHSGNIDELYTSDLKKYIEFTKSYMSRKRLMYTYYLVYLKQKKQADEIYLNALKMSKVYCPKGEAITEMEIINFIKESVNIN